MDSLIPAKLKRMPNGEYKVLVGPGAVAKLSMNPYMVKTWETGHHLFPTKQAAKQYAQKLADKSGTSGVYVEEKGPRGKRVKGRAPESFMVWPRKRHSNPKKVYEVYVRGEGVQYDTERRGTKADAKRVLRRWRKAGYDAVLRVRKGGR